MQDRSIHVYTISLLCELRQRLQPLLIGSPLVQLHSKVSIYEYSRSIQEFVDHRTLINFELL